MRAGLASNPAITAWYSPASSPDERSTIRYWTVLVSGTRSLGEELLDRLHGVRPAPVALAEHPMAHAPFRIHDERHRQASDFPIPRRILLRIEQHRQCDPFPGDERRDLLGKLAVVHGEDLKRPAGELCLQSVERGHLFLARLAPRGPEIHHDHAAAKVLEVDLVPGKIDSRQRRRGFS